jgi:hypothetical protein
LGFVETIATFPLAPVDLIREIHISRIQPIQYNTLNIYFTFTKEDKFPHENFSFVYPRSNKSIAPFVVIKR